MFIQGFPASVNEAIFTRSQLRRAIGRLAIGPTVATDWSTVASYVIPENERGYITGFSNEVIDPSWDYNGGILFRISVQGSALTDLDSFQEQFGSLSAPAECLQYVQPGNTILLQARRAVTGTTSRDVVMGCVIRTWPQQLERIFPLPPTPAAQHLLR